MSSNELSEASSPYLLQHRDNPVHWKEWSPQTLELACRLKKPILLSIGYAACHWCHVMAHESFEDESTAELMNRHFINIKIDREERPDLDQIYMTALQAMGQQGGWPLTMFLTSEGEAFWGGTYFPKTPSFGRPTFKEVLNAVVEAHTARQPQIENNVAQLRAVITKQKFSAASHSISDGMLTDFAKRLHSHFDDVHGGLSGAPKFPNAAILEFFFRRALRTGNESFLTPAIKTLQGMCSGGIRDHIGGGFARYSVDERWFVPHFEKMLYDNAQLLELLAIAWQTTKVDEFRTAANELVEWLQQEMLVDGKMFASSLDADSEGVEGKYYCWTLDELESVLSSVEIDLLRTFFNLEENGNWTEHHTGLRTNIISQLERPLPGGPEAQAITTIKAKLLAARKRRIPPGKDDKILMEWNSLMIAALARAAMIFDQPRWLDLARDCYHSVIESMTEWHSGKITVARSLRNGRLVKPGMSSDYACLIRATLTLHDSGIVDRFLSPAGATYTYLGLAQHLADSLIAYHADPETGLLSLARKEASDVPYRHISTIDDAVPNPNSIFLQCLQVLAAIEAGGSFLAQANRMIDAITSAALENPFGHASFLNAIDAYLNNYEIVITGHQNAELLKAARSGSFLTRFVIDGTGENEILPPHLRSTTGTTQAVICRNSKCSLPLNSIADIEAELRNDIR